MYSLAKRFPLIFILLLCDLLYFFPFLNGEKIIGRLDTYYQFLPYFIYLKESLKTFSIPLWWEYTGLGYPFIGVIQSSVLYFPNYPLFMFNNVLSYNLSIILHFVFLQIVLFKLYREYLKDIFALLATSFFSFSFYILIHLDISTMVYSMPYFFINFYILKKLLDNEEKDLFLYLKKNKIYIILGALSFSLEFLAGYPQLVAYNILYFLIFIILYSLIIKKINFNFLISLLTIIILSIPLLFIQYLTTIELAKNSWRNLLKDYLYDTGSLPPYMLVTYIFPYIFGGIGNLTYLGPETNAIDLEFINHISIITLPTILFTIYIAIRSKNKSLIILSIMGIIALLLSFGKYTLFHYIFQNLPIYSDFRVHCRNMLVVNFILSLFSSLGIFYIIKLISIKPSLIKRIFLYLITSYIFLTSIFLIFINFELPIKDLIKINIKANKELFINSLLIITLWFLAFLPYRLNTKYKTFLPYLFCIIFLTESYSIWVNMNVGYLKFIPSFLERKEILCSLEHLLKYQNKLKINDKVTKSKIDNIIVYNREKSLSFLLYNLSSVITNQYYINTYDPFSNKYLFYIFKIRANGQIEYPYNIFQIINNRLLSIYSVKYILINKNFQDKIKSYVDTKVTKVNQELIKFDNFILLPEKQIELEIPNSNHKLLLIKLNTQIPKYNTLEKLKNKLKEKEESITIITDNLYSTSLNKNNNIQDKNNYYYYFILIPNENSKITKLSIINNLSKELKINDVNIFEFTLEKSENKSNYLKIFENKDKLNIIGEIWENKNSFPRIYSVENVKTIENFNEFVDYLYTLKVNFNKTCLVENQSKELEKENYSKAKIENLKFFEQKDTIEFETESNGPSFIVINVSYHKDWKCYLNNITQIPIFKTNGIVQGIIVPKGKNKITLKFEPPYKKYLFLPFILSLLYLFLIIVWYKKEN